MYYVTILFSRGRAKHEGPHGWTGNIYIRYLAEADEGKEVRFMRPEKAHAARIP